MSLSHFMSFIRCAAALLCAAFVLLAPTALPAVAQSGKDARNAKDGIGKQKPPVQPVPMANQTIPGVPIQTVVHDSGSAAVYYNGVGQFYSDNAEGIYVWANGQVWGPSDVPLGPTVNNYTPVRNSLTGSGTVQSPWRTTTVLRLGTTGLQLIRSVRYVNGNLFTRQDFEIVNSSTRQYTVSLFHAADLQTSGDGSGYGYYDSSTGGIGGYNQQRTFYQLFMPLTGGSKYKEGLWNVVWPSIGGVSGPGPGFDNSYHPDTYEDNAAGLQWTYSLPTRARVNFAEFQTLPPRSAARSTFPMSSPMIITSTR